MKVVAVCTASREQEAVSRYCQFAARNQVVPLGLDCFWAEWEEGEKENETKEEQEKGKKNHEKETAHHNIWHQQAENQELKRVMNYELLSRCDELWVFGSPISVPVKELIKMSMRLKKPMLYFNHRCELLLDLIGLKGEF